MSCNCNASSGSGYHESWCNSAPGPCNPAFPPTCSPFDLTTQGIRLLVEDSAGCKYTIQQPSDNCVLGYNSVTGLLQWQDGSATYPIVLPNMQSTTAGQVMASFVAEDSNGKQWQLKGASNVSEAQIPVQAANSDSITMTTIEALIPNQGLVYKNSGGTVAELTGTSSQVVSFDGSGNPVAVAATTFTTTNGFVDANAISLHYSSGTLITVTFGQLVVTNAAGASLVITNANTYNLNLSSSGGVNKLDTGTLGASSYYYVFAIYNATTSTIGTLASLSPTAPTLPSGYTHVRMIGLFATNSSSFVDAGYNQNGRVVNLGYTANIPVLILTDSDKTHKFWSGTVSYISSSYASQALMRLDFNAASNAYGTQSLNITINNQSAGSTSSSYTPVPVTFECYGACFSSNVFNAAVSTSYSTMSVFIPQTGASYYNASATTVQGTGDFLDLKISGYVLSIF